MANSGAPRSFVVFAVSTIVLTAGVFWQSWVLDPPQVSAYLVLLVLATFVAEYAAVRLPNGGSTSVAYPMSLAAVLLLGPTSGAIVAAFSGLNPDDIRGRRPPLILLFNLAQLVLSATLAGWVYVALGGRTLIDLTSGLTIASPINEQDFPRVLLAYLALAVVSFMVNAVFVGLGVALNSGRSVLEVWRVGIAWTAPMQLALAVVGFAIAQVLAVSLVGFLLLVFPLVVSRQLYQRYLGLKDAYLDTVRSLVGAIEAKDPYTKGHSDRVAEYAAMIGQSIGLEDSALERLRFAAQLHDLGKVGVPPGVLSKAGPLTSDEFEFIRSHPSFGAELVARVPYLEDIVGDIEHHHERYDGRGYASGLSGEEIPLGARVLAVADSYDAMTTKRPYREAMTQDEAVEELRVNSGTQFDPAMVLGLLGALEDGVDDA